MLFMLVLETDMTSCYFSYYLKLAISLKVVLKYIFRETTNFFFLEKLHHTKILWNKVLFGDLMECFVPNFLLKITRWADLSEKEQIMTNFCAFLSIFYMTIYICYVVVTFTLKLMTWTIYRRIVPQMPIFTCTFLLQSVNFGFKF